MKKYIVLLLPVILILGCSMKKRQTVCVLQTNMGTMVFRFFEQEAPHTSAEIQKLVKQGFYDGKDFYRVVQGHVIQTGGGGDPLKAEFNSRSHLTGTVGLARDEDPDSGDSSFYICLAPRPHLDGEYTVFGQLIEGMDVLEAIGNVEVEEKYSEGIAFHEPVTPVIIEHASLEKRVLEPSGDSE
ncbi:peptidylprolyl isomerase [bacterium]|nr:peptidylprolyl isomerase [bacterium]